MSRPLSDKEIADANTVVAANGRIFNADYNVPRLLATITADRERIAALEEALREARKSVEANAFEYNVPEAAEQELARIDALLSPVASEENP